MAHPRCILANSPRASAWEFLAFFLPRVLAIVRFERCLQGNRKPGRLRLERTGSAIRPSSQKRSVKAHRMQQRQQVQAFESAFPPWLRHHASRRLRSRPPVAIHAVHAMRRSPPPKRGRRGTRGPAGSSTLPPRHARTADGRERSLAAPWSPPARDADGRARVRRRRLTSPPHRRPFRYSGSIFRRGGS